MKLLALCVTTTFAYDPTQAYLFRDAYYKADALNECHDRGIIASNTGYADGNEKLKCRAMLIDISKEENMSARAKNAGFVDMIKTACLGIDPANTADGSEMPEGCRNHFLAMWPDFKVLFDFDAASDAYCAGVTFGNGQTYSAAQSDIELVVNNQAGPNRCACLGKIDSDMANMNLLGALSNCAGNPSLPYCDLVHAAAAVCTEYDLLADCKGALQAAYSNDSGC